LSALKAGMIEINATWEPDLPTCLSPSEMNDYRRGRDALLAEAAQYIGGRVAVFEV
jgi:hypothetical protein